MNLKLFVFIVVLYGVLCQVSDSSSANSYQLPDGDRPKSLNVTITSGVYQTFQITIECYNYNSLKYFGIRLGELKKFELRNRFMLDFIKCFNNATGNENYNYKLGSWFNSLPNFNTSHHNEYRLMIKFDEYADINSDVLFKDFDFQKFDNVKLINVGWVSSKFLKQLNCQSCLFDNNGRIDFNGFGDGVTNTTRLDIISNKLINFNRDNLNKFSELYSLEIIDFDLDDYNTFNVPMLFEGSVKTQLLTIIIEKSKDRIVLHEQVFRGLVNLRTIILKKLQLDFIPKDLFKDLTELYSVYLMGNNIKTVDPTTFQTNQKLSYISFAENPFFTEPHDKLEEFYFNGQSMTLYLANFTSHTFDLLEQLIKNSNVSAAKIQSFLVDRFDIRNFRRAEPQRNSSAVDIVFIKVEPTLDLEFVKSYIINIQIQQDLVDAVIHAKLADDGICRDCTMVKRLFPHFLKRYQSPPGFYFESNHYFVEFYIPDSCRHFEEFFDESFEENCPENCTCKFSPILDKVRINCNNKNLTAVPHIPYPVQYDKLNSIDLNFENNSISVLSLGNQSANILEKLSTLNFKNNKIETVEIDAADLSKNIWAMSLCDNPIVGDNSYKSFNLASGYTYFSSYSCKTNPYPDIGVYVEEHKSTQLERFLNDFNCN